MTSAAIQSGAVIGADGVRFCVPAPDATAVWLCLFDGNDYETERLPMTRQGDWWIAEVRGVAAGQRYGYRADGAYAPHDGHWFDPQKLLADPSATRIDRPWRYDAALALPRDEAVDTAPLVPKCIVERIPAVVTPAPVSFRPGGLVYEVNVRGFSMRHPDIPEIERGTLMALAHPAVIAHLRRIGVTAVELMPVTAWIDERHLGPLGLSNAWGYNPVTFMAPDPRLAPGGIDELRHVTDALRAEGISVFLDLVFNHTGESDIEGPTLSLRGLMGRRGFLHEPDGGLANVTGTGNTVACNDAIVSQLIIDALRHFILAGGVDGFRFDLAPVLGRTNDGFSPDAPLIRAMMDDPVIASRILIAEPWDIGPDGYQLGNFPPPFLEWNDKYRDDIRRFWRGEAHMRGTLATRLAGSSDIFGGAGRDLTRTVNFIAAHDGFTLWDLVSHETKHNKANGEDNRDGHNHNISWNNGAEGRTADASVNTARRADVKALLSTLYASRGTIMLTAGDEFGRSQGGNNNAYAQDNETTWIDWTNRDRELEDHAAMLAALRARFPALSDVRFLTGEASECGGFADVEWRDLAGELLTEESWREPHAGQLKKLVGTGHVSEPHVAFLFNRARAPVTFALPEAVGMRWTGEGVSGHSIIVPPRSVGIAILERIA